VLTCRRDAKSCASNEESARRAQAEAKIPRKARIGEARDYKKRLCCRRFLQSRVERSMRARSESSLPKALEGGVVDSESFVLARKIFS
jgi:hypothetical protein